MLPASAKSFESANVLVQGVTVADRYLESPELGTNAHTIFPLDVSE